LPVYAKGGAGLTVNGRNNSVKLSVRPRLRDHVEGAVLRVGEWPRLHEDLDLAVDDAGVISLT